jgi:ATP-dependent DNA ligase
VHKGEQSARLAAEATDPRLRATYEGEARFWRKILDGEVVIMTPAGRSDFAALESSMSSKAPSPQLRFYVFDILYLEVFDLRGCSLLDRKKVLKAFLEKVDSPIHYSEHFEAEGPEVYRSACEMELEGIVSKRVDGKYQSGRTDTWIKTTCRHRDTFAVVGIAQKAGKFDGIYLGKREGRKLVYAGKLERGFTDEDKRRILELHDRLKTRAQPNRGTAQIPQGAVDEAQPTGRRGVSRENRRRSVTAPGVQRGTARSDGLNA